MKCPRCQHALEALTLDARRQVDWCSGCGGAFYQAGELEAALKLGKLPSDARGQEARPGVLCPACGTACTERSWPPGSKVRVDACAACGGRWLDAGELDRLRDQLGGQLKEQVGQSAQGQAVRLPARRLGLSPTWVLLGLLMMLVCSAFALGLLRFGALFEAVSDRGALPGVDLVLVAGLLGAGAGGFLVGRGSSGFTLWEAPVAWILAGGVLLAWHGPAWPVALGLALGGAVLALGGALLGERLQGR